MHRLTAVFAHPDDETYATGGTFAKYAGSGVRCSLYCATDGDAGGSSGIPVSSRAELASLRRSELHVACDLLGITTVVTGGHADGALAAADADVVLSEIVGLLRRECPDVVITFGPEGAPTKHRDHRAISRLATAATLLAGTRTAFPEQLVNGIAPHRASRLCYVTWPTPDVGDAYDVEGQPIQIRVPMREWHARKVEAFLAHRTQRQHRESFDRIALPMTEDYFVVSGVAAPTGCEDLFAAV